MPSTSKTLPCIGLRGCVKRESALVRGRVLTSYHSIQDDICNAGGNWVDREVVEDGNWVTSRQPGDLPAFNRAMLGLFSKSRVAQPLV
jgi:protease I